MYNTLQQLVSSPDFEHSTPQRTEVTDRQLIDAVRAYLSELPHLSPLAQSECAIDEVRERYLYLVDVSAIFETREVERKEVPYRNWRIPALGTDESSVEKWSYKMAIKCFDDDLSAKTSIVADSQSLHDCHRCGADGVIDCQNCHSTGKVRCGTCRGTKQVVCSDCSGSGQIQKSRSVSGVRKCPHCTINLIFNAIAKNDDNPYTQSQVCSTCHGTRVQHYVETETYNVMCEACHGSGRLGPKQAYAFSG